jgi:hypothetical protein
MKDIIEEMRALADEERLHTDDYTAGVLEDLANRLEAEVTEIESELDKLRYALELYAAKQRADVETLSEFNEALKFRRKHNPYKEES